MIDKKSLSEKISSKFITPTIQNAGQNIQTQVLKKLITVKLDELMAFCDGLEQSIKESQGDNGQVLQQVLRKALQGKEKV